MRNRIVILIWFMVGGSQGLALQAQANLRGGVWPPLFQQTVNHWKGEVQGLMEEGILVPTPKDMAGGYSHEVHKRNFFLLPKAAALYQLTGEEKYAAYVKEVFFAYAKAYPGWGKHPSTRSYARGKIFWQCLNDANWLVYMSQAYAGIYDMLSAKERETLETQLFRPCADYLSLENPRFFNRIHNHSTWGNAAVGMIALVMQDDVLLNRALYGLEGQPTFGEATDNDGGRINIPGQNKAGFLAQLDHAFSPDGYYTEGPYYQRYAMSPFIMFAQVLHQQRPELGIFAYRDSLLKKAVFALLQQTDGAGAFFPINDAQKGMSYLSRELIQAVDVVYALCGKDARLLSVAEDQGRVLLDKTGYTVAEDLAAGEAKPFHKWSQIFTDGANGDEGALAILRPRNPAFPITAVFKYAAQGMGHGHFDRLSYALYEGSTEALQDYGSARWVNIDQKGGGGYLKENKTWAKQSLAHNTLILDQTSHFQGKTQKGSEWAGEPYFSDLSRPDAQVVSAKETHAYPGVTMQRTLCLLEDSVLDEPILLDVFRVAGETAHPLDLPFHFQTQLLAANFEYKTFSSPLVLGSSHGYQHVWKEAAASLEEGPLRMTWFSDLKFFELTTHMEAGDSALLCRVGAADPEFNLRRDAFLLLRKPAVKDALIVSAVRAHGNYSPVSEIPRRPYPPKLTVQTLHSDAAYSVVSLSIAEGPTWIMGISNQDSSAEQRHSVDWQGKTFTWQGPFFLSKI